MWWLWLAVALGSALPESKKSIDDCTSFSEVERDDGGVDFAITNRCEVKLSCGIKWTVTCAPHTKKAKKTKGAVAFELDDGMSDGTTASTEQCGFDAWEITDVSWSCEPVH